jgi:hypothetical protein
LWGVQIMKNLIMQFCPFISSLLGPNFPLSTLYTNIHNVFSFFKFFFCALFDNAISRSESVAPNCTLISE